MCFLIVICQVINHVFFSFNCYMSGNQSFFYCYMSGNQSVFFKLLYVSY